MANAFTIGSTYLISANVVNSLRLTANRTATLNETAEFFAWSDYGSTVVSPYPKRSLFSITGGFSVGSATQGGPATSNLLGGNDDVGLAAEALEVFRSRVRHRDGAVGLQQELQHRLTDDV